MLSLLVKAAVIAAVVHHPAAAKVTVHPGDTLSGIAVTQCTRANDWTGIYARNRGLIGSDPNLIQPGQRLAIVCTDPPALLRAAARSAPAAPSTGSAAGDHDGDSDQAAAPATTDGDGDHDGDRSDSGAAAPAPQPAAPVSNVSTGGMSAFQACVIARESGGNPTAVNPTSGAGGLYQFLPSSWQALGFSGLPQNASVAEQNAAFAKQYAISGTAAWAPYDGC